MGRTSIEISSSGIRIFICICLAFHFFGTSPASAQYFPMGGGAVATGSNTTCFPITVSGVGQLVPSWAGSGAFIADVCFSITTSHPQTLVINLVSPTGTTLLLSSYNGAGGANYTNTCFSDAGWMNINLAVGPCTGTFFPEGGSMSVFDWENPNGTWNLCVTDTLSDTTGMGTTVMMSSGGMNFGFANPPPPPCFGMLSDNYIQICQGGTADLTALYSLPPFFTVNWYLNSPFGTPIPAPTAVSTGGTYVITITDNMGCTDDAFVQVTVSPPIQLGADQTQTACQGTTVNLNTFLNIPAGLIRTWSIGGIPMTPAAAVAVSQSGTYRLIASNNAGCRDTVLVNLAFLPAPALGADQSQTLCQGGVLDLGMIYNTTGLSSSWTFSGMVVPDPTAVSVPGNYMLVASDINGCNDTAFVSLAFTNPPSLGPDKALTYCSGSAVDLTGLFNTSGLTSTWTLSGMTVNTPAAVISPGNYHLLVTDPSGCTDEAYVSLNSMPGPSLGADQQAGLCPGGSIDLNTFFQTGSMVSDWSVAGVPVSSPYLVTQPGNYDLVVTDMNGCMDTARLAISSYNAPQPGADQYHSICPWMSLDLQTLYGTSGWNTFWTFNGQPVNATQEVRDSGSYVLSVTDSNGCEAQAIVYLALMDCRCDAAIDFEGRCVEELVHLRAVADSLILNVTWSFDDPIISQAIGQEVEVKLSSVDSITITMDAELSCGHQTQTRRIKLEECAPACEVFVPSAFSPNSDDLNEVFSVYSECRPIAYHLEIHNRLGELVFQSDEMTAKWDGQTMSGEPAEDIYVYRLEYRMPYQNQTVRVGKVALVR